LHGLYPHPEKPGLRGKPIVGQYYEAFPGHQVDLATPLTRELAHTWAKRANELGIPAAKLPAADGRTTRGDWIRAAFSARSAP
jgi:hypothetical protein